NVAFVARYPQPSGGTGVNRFGAKRFFLFVLDGTLVDSSSLHERGLRETLVEHAPKLLERLNYEALKGKSTAEAFLDLGVPGGESIDIMVSEKQRRYRDAVRAGELPLTPGSRKTLELLRRQRQHLFVVTGGSRRSVEAALASTGI